MKILQLHTDTTIAHFNSQLFQLIHCHARVYSTTNNVLQNNHTLYDAGFINSDIKEYPIEETMHIRQFEQDFLLHFNVLLELCDEEEMPLKNKALRLYQLIAKNKLI